MINLPDEFVFSQSSLQDYVDCPRRFQLRYLLRQRWPAPEVEDVVEFERRMALGEQFHHLVHQHLIGIPAEALTRRLDGDLRRWFETYLAHGLDDVPDQRSPEATLTVPLGEHLLLAKFDLLALEPGGRALIVDWKTTARAARAEWLAGRMQTIVYRYALARGGYGGRTIAPEQIEMIYWYAAAGGEARRLAYDAAQYAADEALLLKLAAEIDTRAEFPLTPDERQCRFCVYRSLCERGDTAGDLDEWDAEDREALDLSGLHIDIDQIGEIEF